MADSYLDLETVGAGFAQPVDGAQTVFRRVLSAMSRPGRIVEMPDALAAGDRPLQPAATSLALTLLDHETPVWLDSALGAAGDFIRFHCNASITDHPAESRFAFATDIAALPALDAFDLGTADYPDR